MNIKLVISILSILLLTTASSHKSYIQDQTGDKYQSKIQLNSEIDTELFVKYKHIEELKNSFVDMNGKVAYEENYQIYKYKVLENQYVRIEGSLIVNPDFANRFAFYEDENGHNLLRCGWLNSGGWSDDYKIDVTVPKNANYLFVSSQSEMLPSVKLAQMESHYYIDVDGGLFMKRITRFILMQ